MSNRNTIADVIYSQNNGQPIVLAAKTALHQSFQVNGGTAVLTIPNPMALIEAAAAFPSRSAQALPFIIRAAGTVTGGERYQIDLNQGTGLTGTIASTGLAINGLTNDNWLVEAECLWDSASTFLRGIYYGWAGNQSVGQATLIIVNKPADLTQLQFNVAVTIANANVNASFSLTEFSAELI